ncbi:MAG: hypothetical protein ACYTFQ_26485 [Planctomycetota bacterium]|jgi:hypothetical protein
MGGLFVLIFLIFIVVPVCLGAGILASFLGIPVIYRIRRKACPIGFAAKSLLSLFFAVLFIFLFLATIACLELRLAKDYWKYPGAYDWYRMPLEYPYELHMIDDINDAGLRSWAEEDGTLSEDISGIRRYHKQGNLVFGQYVSRRIDRPPHTSWFTFDCNTGHVEKFLEKEDYLESIRMLGFEKEPNLLTVRENWEKYWSSK